MSDSILMPKELTAENGAKNLFIGEFYTIHNVDCIDCEGTGFTDKHEECLGCYGDGTHEQKTFIEWSMIKDIYKMAVDNLGESK